MKFLALSTAFTVLAVLALSSCVTSDTQSSGRYGQDGLSRGGRGGAAARRGGDGGVDPGAMQRGTDSFINGGALRGGDRSQAIVVPADGSTVELSLINASVEAAARAVLGDTLKLSYVVSDQVQGRITIQTTGPIPKAALLELFEGALAANGAQIKREGNVIRIVPGSSGATAFRMASQGGASGASILVAPLKYISAAEMGRLLEPLGDQGLNVVVDKKRNLILMSGPTPAQEAALDALNLFDVDVLQGKSIAIVRLKSADPDAIVGELQRIFETEEGGTLSGVVEFIPNRRLGSVLIISSRAVYLDKAQRWIRELDTTASGSAVYLATYELQNRSAVEVAPILNDLLSEGSGEAGAEGADRSSAPRVAADDSRNALIVRARRSQHNEIEAILRSLDDAPRQVLLEATIAEVTLNNEVNVGTRWFFESGNWGFRFSDLASGGVAANNPSFSAVFGAGGAQLALSALSSVTDVKVISAPTLMVINNKEGILQIGDQVPIATQTTSGTESENAPVLTRVEYRDTGIILRVKPRIGSNGSVILDISQEVSDVIQTSSSGIDSPTIRTRKIQTSVALGDGQTLALGGLVQESDNASRTETPGLGKVPVVGNLFRSKKSKKGRTELLILIRPRVVMSSVDAAAVTNYWRSKLSTTNSVLQTGLGAPRHTVRDFSQ